MDRHDYAFPFRIDPSSRQAAQTSYAAHVEQMIRQVLLTDPGERVNVPDFGCGLRRVIFAPNSDALAATTQILVQQALDKWLGNQIQVQTVTVTRPNGDPAQLVVEIHYTLIETQAQQSLAVKVI